MRGPVAPPWKTVRPTGLHRDRICAAVGADRARPGNRPPRTAQKPMSFTSAVFACHERPSPPFGAATINRTPRCKFVGRGLPAAPPAGRCPALVIDRTCSERTSNLIGVYMKSHHRVFNAPLFGLLFAGLLSVSCQDNTKCVGGKQCNCDADSCHTECESNSKGNCQFECAGGTCSNVCDGGNCQMNCTSEVCELDCAGGGCQLTCGSDTKECRITSCQTGCQLTCNGADVCESSCGVTGACQTTP